MRKLRIAVLLAVLSVAGCGTRPAQPGARGAVSAAPASGSAAPAKVSLGQVGGLSDAAFFIAQDKGYFREQSIEVESTRFISAVKMLAPLSTGQLDVGGGAPSAGLFNAIAGGVQLKIVADKGNLNPGNGYEALLVRKALADELQTPADFKGRIIALSGRDISAEVTLDTYLKGGGLTTKDVQILTMSFPEMVTALSNRSVDAAQAIEPTVAEALEKGVAVLRYSSDQITPSHQTAVVFYSPQFASQKPDLARKFMLAYITAARYYADAFVNNDPAKKQEVARILLNHATVKDASLLDKMRMPGINPDGHVNVSSLEEQQAWFLARGSETRKLALDSVLDDQYVKWANAQLGSYGAPTSG